MKQKVALVLSAGGARGLAEAGAIYELEQSGFEISSVAGSSIGSVIGGLYAMNKLDDYIQWLKNFQKRDVFSLMDFTFSKKGLIKGEKVFREMKTFIPDILIEEMQIPYVALASDLFAKKPVIFDKGSFYEAIRASTAIPNVIIPVKKGNTILVDGGVLNPLPMQYVKRNEGDILVVINLYSENEEQKKEKKKPQIKSNGKLEKHEKEVNLHIARFNQSIEHFYKKIVDYIPKGDKMSTGHFTLIDMATKAVLHRMAELTLQLYKPDILINIPANIAGTFDFYKTDFLVEYGKKKAKKAIEEWMLQNP